jgi:hypothetical protein
VAIQTDLGEHDPQRRRIGHIVSLVRRKIDLLTPVIQDNQLVGQVQARLLEFLDGGDHVLGLHVVFGVIVKSDYQDPVMSASGSLEEIMQIFEVFIVTCQEDETFFNCKFQVPWIRCPRHADIGRTHCRMTTFCEQCCEGRVRKIIVQIDFHDAGL